MFFDLFSSMQDDVFSAKQFDTFLEPHSLVLKDDEDANDIDSATGLFLSLHFWIKK
jgi:hypothetical protein